MNAVVNDYSHGTLVGRGFETEFNGGRVSMYAWDNGNVDRIRAIPQFTDHLIITSSTHAIPGLETTIREADLRAPESLPWNGSEEIAEAIKPFAESADFYRGIVNQIGELLGPEAKTSDDGSVQLDVLALKVPELVKKLLEKPTPDVVTPADLAPSIPPASVETQATEEPVPDWAPTPGASESETIRSCLTYFGAALPNKDIIAKLAAVGISVTASQVFVARKAIGK